MTDLDRVRAILDAASDAPWQWLDSGGEPGESDELQDGNGEMVAWGFREDLVVDGTPITRDGTAAALARNLLPAALDVVEAARRASDKRTFDSDGFWISAREMRYIDEALDAYDAKMKETL